MSLNRRDFLKASAALATTLAAGCAATTSGSNARGRVVVIGGGFGGATAAKYLRKWAPGLDVTLVERNASFISCPLSNLVLAGTKTIDDITLSYDGLKGHGVRLVRDEALAIDPEKRQVRLANGEPLPWDRLIVAPGIDFLYDRLPGLNSAEAQAKALHAWKAGPQTVALRQKLQGLRNGGTFVISVPLMPYRCPPGPFERASVVAEYFKQHKPRSKLIILDANPDIVSKKALFTEAWSTLYPGIVEYRANSEVVDFDPRRNRAITEFDEVQADLFNIIPPQRAGAIAAPLVNVSERWVGVEFLGFESQAIPGIHVIGDAIAAAPKMPKSGFMANNHAKLAADAVIAHLAGIPVNSSPIIANTCYSFVSAQEAVHVASVHKFDPKEQTLISVEGAGGLSASRNRLEADYALAWARNIWADTLK